MCLHVIDPGFHVGHTTVDPHASMKLGINTVYQFMSHNPLFWISFIFSLSTYSLLDKLYGILLSNCCIYHLHSFKIIKPSLFSLTNFFAHIHLWGNSSLFLARSGMVAHLFQECLNEHLYLLLHQVSLDMPLTWNDTRTSSIYARRFSLEPFCIMCGIINYWGNYKSSWVFYRN